MVKLLIQVFLYLIFISLLLLKTFGEISCEWGTVFIPLILANSILAAHVNSAMKLLIGGMEKALGIK